jgi:hypothetical protein
MTVVARSAVCAALAAVLMPASACGDRNVVTNSYATHGEAVRAGAVNQGWIPGGLPTGIFDIREAHDLDRPRRRWGLFSFPAEDADALARLLARQVSVDGETCDPPARIEWWPLLLRGVLDDERLATTGLKVYRPENERLTFAVNWNQRRAYYWSPE